ncbi:hypothetical protein JKP88DRAFT_248140, partial [Tribonema minus]
MARFSHLAPWCCVVLGIVQGAELALTSVPPLPAIEPTVAAPVPGATTPPLGPNAEPAFEGNVAPALGPHMAPAGHGDTNCTRLGIRHPDPNNKACCKASCGAQCGTSTCQTAGMWQCCGYAILAANRPCSMYDPPCVRAALLPSTPRVTPAPVPPPVCGQLGGLLSADQASCCPAACGACGGLGCAQRAGGAAQCCGSTIQANSTSCGAPAAAPPCVISAAPCPAGVCSGSIAREVALGLYTSALTPLQREALYGVDFQYVLRFQSIFNLNYTDIAKYLDQRFTPILNIEFQSPDDRTMTGAPVLPFLVRGYYDKYLVAFADECVAAGRPFWIRTLHEFN